MGTHTGGTETDAGGEGRRMILVRVSGRDRPGITNGLLEVMAAAGVEVYDMEQVVVRERLTLDILIEVPPRNDVLKDLLFYGWEADIHVDFEIVEPASLRDSLPRFAVTAIGQPLTPSALEGITRAIAEAGGNIDRIVRLSRYPVTSYEFVVVDGDPDDMRAGLVRAAADHGVDVAVQRESLERRAKRLVMLDMDSTLIQDEVVELLAAEAGCGREVAAITEQAMRGEIDFETALRERVRLLAGLDLAALERVRERITVTPGARTFVRTLRRLGFTTGVVSGGFLRVVQPIAEEIGIRHIVANELAVEDGRLTGELTGRIVDRPAKADVLREVAEAEGVSLEQTVAVGDGANDLDMLAAAGLGIAFNAKPVVREAADTSVTVPYLDAVLFLLGIRREEVERADAEDPEVAGSEPVPVPGTPPV